MIELAHEIVIWLVKSCNASNAVDKEQDKEEQSSNISKEVEDRVNIKAHLIYLEAHFETNRHPQTFWSSLRTKGLMLRSPSAYDFTYWGKQTFVWLEVSFDYFAWNGCPWLQWDGQPVQLRFFMNAIFLAVCKLIQVLLVFQDCNILALEPFGIIGLFCIFTYDCCVKWVTNFNGYEKLLGFICIIVSIQFKFFGIIEALESLVQPFEVTLAWAIDWEELTLLVDKLICVTKAEL